MNDYYFSMYFNKHIMKVEQFYKLVKVKTGGRGMDHDGGTISSPSTTIIDVDNNTTATFPVSALTDANDIIAEAK